MLRFTESCQRGGAENAPNFFQRRARASRGIVILGGIGIVGIWIAALIFCASIFLLRGRCVFDRSFFADCREGGVCTVHSRPRPSPAFRRARRIAAFGL